MFLWYRYAVRSQRFTRSKSQGPLPDNESIVAGYGLDGQERMYRPTTTSSRNNSACTIPTPDVSHIPTALTSGIFTHFLGRDSEMKADLSMLWQLFCVFILAGFRARN